MSLFRARLVMLLCVTVASGVASTSHGQGAGERQHAEYPGVKILVIAEPYGYGAAGAAQAVRAKWGACGKYDSTPSDYYGSPTGIYEPL